MCLHLDKNYVAHTYTEDITCYKVMRRLGDNEWTSAYMGAPADDDVISGRKPFEPDQPGEEAPRLQDNWPVVDESYIHTFEFYDDAAKEAQELSSNSDFKHWKLGVFECVIPKGTAYYTGFISCTGIPGYASERVVFIKCCAEFINLKE